MFTNIVNWRLLMNEFVKSHGLGNEYVVLNSEKLSFELNDKAIKIWERGAGFTLASGTSSCAVVSVLKKRKLVENKVKVKLLGGELIIHVDDEYNVRMTGPVSQSVEGVLSSELIEDIEK